MTIWLGGAQGSRTQTEELVLRFKTARPAGLLLLTSAESNSPDRLDISLVAGRVRASVRMGEREKVRTYFCILFCNYFPNITVSPRSFSPARVCSTTTIGTRFGSHGAPRTFGFRLTGLPPSGVRYVCINSTLFAPINACRDVSLKKRIIKSNRNKNNSKLLSVIKISNWISCWLAHILLKFAVKVNQNSNISPKISTNTYPCGSIQTHSHTRAIPKILPFFGLWCVVSVCVCMRVYACVGMFVYLALCCSTKHKPKNIKNNKFHQNIQKTKPVRVYCIEFCVFLFVHPSQAYFLYFQQYVFFLYIYWHISIYNQMTVYVIGFYWISSKITLCYIVLYMFYSILYCKPSKRCVYVNTMRTILLNIGGGYNLSVMLARPICVFWNFVSMQWERAIIALICAMRG